MIQTIDQPESEENQNAPPTLEQLQAVLTDHFDGYAKIGPQDRYYPEGAPLLEVNFSWLMSDGFNSVPDVLAGTLRDYASKFLAAASRIDELSGHTDNPGFYIRPDHAYRVAVRGMTEDVDITVCNAYDNEDAIRKARETFAFMTNGKPPRKPANEGPVQLECLQGDFHFLVNREHFHNVSITVTNHSDVEEAIEEATAFIEWLQAQASPESGLQTELKIA